MANLMEQAVHAMRQMRAPRSSSRQDFWGFRTRLGLLNSWRVQLRGDGTPTHERMR